MFEVKPWVPFPKVHLGTQSVQECLWGEPPAAAPVLTLSPEAASAPGATVSAWPHSGPFSEGSTPPSSSPQPQAAPPSATLVQHATAPLAASQQTTQRRSLAGTLQGYLDLYNQEKHVLVWRGGEAHVLLHEDAEPQNLLQVREPVGLWQHFRPGIDAHRRMLCAAAPKAARPPSLVR